MNRAALLVLASAVLLASCSNDKINGPFQFAGSCDVFEVTDVTLDTDPANVSRLEAVANCSMGSEIGDVGAVVDFVVTSNTTDNTLVIAAESFYSASQTDILVGAFEGTGTQVSATTINFSGTETYDGGTNDFDDIFGTGEISGGVLTLTAPGSGGWTVVGAID
ncbi:MAG: hypothetical protein H6Q77_2361 [Gemmatimonadetes bacterium]|nr:hypothetical protein [Gemmatimonadota bacterium]